MTTPAGSFSCTLASFSRTARATSREFSPASMMAAPTSASSALSVLAPVRKFAPMPTVATSLSRMGFTPPANFSGSFAISPVVVTRLVARTMSCSPPIST